MTQELSTPADRVLEVLVNGNLSVLTPNERVDYYNRVCGSLGLNPMTSPFAFITLNNKLTLYATKACTDQLRQIHGVSVSEPHISQIGDMYSVAVTATDRSGRQDSDMGIVTVKGLTGENLANAMLKAVTKAKRRVTLSICGLGMLDETEIEDIPASAKRPPVVMPQPRMEPPSVDSSTGEILNRPALAAPRSKQEVAAPVSAPTGAPSGERPISAFWRWTRETHIPRSEVVAHLGHERFEELDAEEIAELMEQLMAKRGLALA